MARTRGVDRRLLGRLAAAALLVNAGVLAAPAGADEGTVSARVTVAEPEACLVVSTDGLLFPDSVFGEDAGAEEVYEVESCSPAEQDFYVRGTNATDGEDVEWTLSDEEAGTNQFMVEAAFPDSVFFPDSFFLSDQNKRAGSIDEDGAAETIDHTLTMPTDGDGSGQTMQFQVVWTAVLAE